MPFSTERPRAPFQQIKDYIVERIASGEWPPDARIPSEHSFVRTLGFSRSTVHRAFRELTSEGYLTTIQGIGTFVVARKQQLPLLQVKPISVEIAERGEKHSARVHLLNQEIATPEVAMALEVPAGSAVFRSIIVHLANNRPVQLADRYVNPSFAPQYLKQDFTLITPSQYLFQLGPLTEVEHIVEAILPDSQMQELLEMEATEPCLFIRRRTWSNSVVVTSAKLVYPGSRFRLSGRFRPSSFEQLVA
jgi:GntR family histidine utilization transcriptional repressor